MEKRMGKRLDDLVNNTAEETKTTTGKTIRKKTLSGKLIDELTIYFRLAIRRNCDSVQNMEDAMWATYFHYNSIDKNSQHDKCPEGPDSWCT